jgi:hypothetical protein
MRFCLAMLLAAGAALLILPGGAAAQDSKKFDAKKIEADFALPVLPVKKGQVLDNEMIVTNDSDGETKTKDIIFSVRLDGKAVVKFYSGKMGDPKKESLDTGGSRWIFKAKQTDPHISTKVTVTTTEDAKVVKIQYIRHVVTDEDIEE